jgi:hypothetical protein
VLLAGLLAALLPGITPAGAQEAPATTATVGRVTLAVLPGGGTDATSIAETHGRAITDAWPQLTALMGDEPSLPLTITFVPALDPETVSGLRWVTDAAWISPNGAAAVVDGAAFAALTPVEAGNVLRNLVSRGFIHAASGGNAPPGLVDGLARYVETPVVAQQARLGSLVQGLHQNGTLPAWDAILAGTAPGLSAEERTASAYALVAFIAGRYGAGGLQAFVQGFADTPAWPDAATAAMGQDAAGIEASWQQFLPRWFASGWRQNAISAFDLTRAETLFSRGAYEAAAAEAERSQRLFLDLDDQAGLSQTETLLALCAVGLQADAIMGETQAALDAHEYDTALRLLANADDLYLLLPENHRPGGIIAEYRSIADAGMAANADLAEAERLQQNWLQVTAARDHALAAGNAYAYLADAEGLAGAQAVLDGLDTRIQRMVFVLSALVVALGGWLGIWMWLHAPARLHWPSSVPGHRPWSTTGGGA